MDDRKGQIIKGYELCEQIGVGGYGAVYRAVQPLVGREVAVKVIHPSYVNHPDFIRRFEAEAHLVARLEHPHIVPLYDYWRDPDGAFLVMRWLREGSLHDALGEGPWPLEAVVRMLDQVAAALTVAHRRGIIHRDLKPANILLDEDGNAYLADFGIAKDLMNTASAYQTQARVIGSPEYLSPEQIENGPITPQTDIYSLGITLYETLTGELPFSDLPLLALLYKHVHDPVPSLLDRRPDLPAALDKVIQRATAKQPQARYPDVLSLVRDVRMTVTMDQATLQRRGDGAITPSALANGNRRRRPSRFDTLRLDDLADLDVAAPPMENPYKGLRAFQEADAADFFGRDALTYRLLARLQEPAPAGRFLAVVGPSGSGKSSVVRAGVIPALRRGEISGSQRWFIVEMFPGIHPMAELEAALLRIAVNPPADLLAQLQQDESGLLRVVNQVLPGSREAELVLVIDQFEELFTRVEDEAERIHLLSNLLTAVTDPNSRVRVILTLRADFYDKPLLYTPFCELMRQRTEVVVPLSPDELREAIVLPAERAGLRLDSDLVEAIVSDVGSQPGTLPMLQYALTELFERRSGRTLTLSPYHATGGVVGALARRAEEIYMGLDAPQREAAQQLFLRLVTLGEGTEDTRRRVRRTELAAVAGDARTLDSVIDQYCAYRLLTIDRDPITRAPTIEVAHEALIRTWDRLRDWLDSSRDDLRLQRRLGAAAAEWNAAGRDDSFLASGARLEQFEIWARDTHLALNEEEQTYLEASLAERETQAAHETARRQHEIALEQRSKKVLRALLGVSLVAALVAFALTAVAYTQRAAATSAWSKAEREAANAKTQEAIAQRNAEDAATAKAQAQQEASNAKAQEANARNSATLAREQALATGAHAEMFKQNVDLALKLALLANATERPLPIAQATLSTVAYAPGTRLLLPGQDVVNSVAYSPDERFAIAGGKDMNLTLWDLTTGKPVRTFRGHTAPVRQVLFLPDGKRVLSASEDATMKLWDVATGQVIRTFTGHTGEVKGAAISPDGTKVLSASQDTTLKLWDIATGKELRTFRGHTQEVNQVVFSPDGARALSASQDTSLILWDVATGQLLKRLQQHTAEVRTVAFSPDGARAISGSDDRTLILWNVATGQPIGPPFVGHTREVYAATFSPDGTQVLSGGFEGSLILWDVATARPLQTFYGHGGYIRAVAFNKRGRQALSASADTTIRLWDLNNGAQQQLFNAQQNAWSVAISPDGRSIVAGLTNGPTLFGDVVTGNSSRTVFHESNVRAVAFTPDGKYVLSAGDQNEGKIILCEAATGKFVRAFSGSIAGINALVVLPDGKSFFTATADNKIIQWDIQTAQPIRTFAQFDAPVNALALSGDGQVLLAAAGSKLSVWDVTRDQQLYALAGHTGKINSVSLSRDGKTALSGGVDKQLILWDTTTGKARWISEDQSAEIRSVALSKDGRTALVGIGMSVQLWDLEAQPRQPIRVFDGHTSDIRQVIMSADERTAISGADDGTVRLWRIDSQAELVQWARANRYVPALTCDQRDLYGINESCVQPEISSAINRIVQ